jgi:hypothetical protein
MQKAFAALNSYVAASQTYAGDYLISFHADCVVVQELDTIVLDMSIEE